MSKINNAVKLIKSIAADNTHGYSQLNRNGNPDFDCSSLVIYVLKESGFRLDGATYTGNMLKPLLNAGFKDVTKNVTLSTGKGLKVGDVLLNVKNHVELVTGSGKITAARSDENGGIRGAKKGDQTGNEISESKYYNYPWDYVLRYEEDKTGSNEPLESMVFDTIIGKYGYGEVRKRNLGRNYDKVQARVNDYYAVAHDVMRGKYGNYPKRKAAIEYEGFNYDVVQMLVNWLQWKI